MLKKQDRLRQSIDYCLKEFGSDLEALKSGISRSGRKVNLTGEKAPLEYMVFICLVAIKGFGYFGKGEKTMWEIPFTYKSQPLSFSYEKFGLRLYDRGGEPASEGIIEEMISHLAKAATIADGIMQPFASAQIRNGNVSLANRFISLDNRYFFFRDKAVSAFEKSEETSSGDKGKSPGAKVPFESLNKRMKLQREGSYYTHAMLDAYFSRLEHLLVVVIPFIGIEFDGKDVVKQISAGWRDKFKRVFNLKEERRAKIIYDKLIYLKDRYRNPATHGDFEKGGASLFFHIPGMGAVPATLSEHRESVHYSFMPINEDSIMKICKVLDEVDAFFTTEKTKYGFRYAETGLDLAFDKKSCAEYITATKTDEEFESFIEGRSAFQDMYDNMDF